MIFLVFSEMPAFSINPFLHFPLNVKLRTPVVGISVFYVGIHTFNIIVWLISSFCIFLTDCGRIWSDLHVVICSISFCLRKKMSTKWFCEKNKFHDWFTDFYKCLTKAFMDISSTHCYITNFRSTIRRGFFNVFSKCFFIGLLLFCSLYFL